MPLTQTPDPSAPLKKKRAPLTEEQLAELAALTLKRPGLRRLTPEQRGQFYELKPALRRAARRRSGPAAD